jgi:phage tail-like protein
MPLGIRLDPTTSFRYGVLVAGVPVGGFTSCSGLEVTRETKDVEEGGINDYVHVLPGRLRHSRLVLKRGIITTSFMWEWLHWGMHDVSVMKMPIVIMLYSVDGIPTRVWAVTDAYPVKWSAGELKSDANQVAVETVEFAHSGIAFVPGGIPVPL